MPPQHDDSVKGYCTSPNPYVRCGRCGGCEASERIESLQSDLMEAARLLEAGIAEVESRDAQIERLREDAAALRRDRDRWQEVAERCDEGLRDRTLEVERLRAAADIDRLLIERLREGAHAAVQALNVNNYQAAHHRLVALFDRPTTPKEGR